MPSLLQECKVERPNSLKQLALKLAAEGPVKLLPTPRLVQAVFNGVYLFRTTQARFVWEHPYYPCYYIPDSEVRHALEEYETIGGPHGHVRRCRLRVGDRSVEDVLAFTHEVGHGLGGLVRFGFASLDQWFEEATPIHVHPKDPFKRVDVLASTREVVVSLDGVRLAKASFAMHLHETGLPVRFYLPLTAVEQSLLRLSETRTKCPYKGEARYYSIEVGGKVYEDLVWYYEAPILECAGIVGMV